MSNSGQIVVQIFVIVIIAGTAYSLWRTTRAYGGLIGGALKWIGLGMIMFSLEALDRVLGDLSFVGSLFGGNAENGEIAHNIILLLGLALAAFGFSRLTKIAKS